MTSTPDVAQLEAQAAQAAEHARVTQATAQAARQAARREFDERRREHRRDRLAAFDPAALRAARRQAQDRLRAAVAADPVTSAWIALEVTRRMEAVLIAEANDDAEALGVQDRRLPGRVDLASARTHPAAN